MLDIIAKESKSPLEFARRAEAWNASSSVQLQDKEIATVWSCLHYKPHTKGYRIEMMLVRDLVKKCRKDRLAKSKMLWSGLVKGIDRNIES